DAACVQPVRGLKVDCRSYDASCGNHCPLIHSGSGIGSSRAQARAALSGCARSCWTCPEFHSASSTSEARSEPCFLFLFVPAHLSGGAVHLVAGFPAQFATNFAARDRIGPFHYDRDRLRCAFDLAEFVLCLLVRAWSHV